jgi:hypothetical protein
MILHFSFSRRYFDNIIVQNGWFHYQLKVCYDKGTHLTWVII